MAAELGPRAMFVAGGTDLYPKLKRRQYEVDALIGLDFLDRRIDGSHVGAGATLADISRDAHLNERYRGYAQAAGLVSPRPCATPARRAATCASTPAATTTT